jgi:hypothetical protein
MLATAQLLLLSEPEAIVDMTDSNFRFLTMEEFNRLTRRDKTAYLEQAAARIKEMKDSAVQSLFKDGPPLPGTEDPLSEKPA